MGAVAGFEVGRIGYLEGFYALYSYRVELVEVCKKWKVLYYWVFCKPQCKILVFLPNEKIQPKKFKVNLNIVQSPLTILNLLILFTYIYKICTHINNPILFKYFMCL